MWMVPAFNAMLPVAVGAGNVSETAALGIGAGARQYDVAVAADVDAAGVAESTGQFEDACCGRGRAIAGDVKQGASIHLHIAMYRECVAGVHRYAADRNAAIAE